MGQKNRSEKRHAVHKRIRRKVQGTSHRPRLCVFRSLNHIYAQVIDDSIGCTVCSASTVEKALRSETGGNLQAATFVGKLIAERARGKGIEQVVFDRGGYIFHGRVKQLAEAAKEAGLKF